MPAKAGIQAAGQATAWAAWVQRAAQLVDGALLRLLVQRDLVMHAGTQVGLEGLLGRMGRVLLLLFAAQVGLEDAGRAHGQEVFVDDGLGLGQATGDQGVQVRAAAAAASPAARAAPSSLSVKR